MRARHEQAPESCKEKAALWAAPALMAAEVRQPIQGVAYNYSVPEAKNGGSFSTGFLIGRRETRTSDPTMSGWTLTTS